MSKKKLLEEGTVRQFMKLANLKPLASDFITENYMDEDLYEQEEEMEDEMLPPEAGAEMDMDMASDEEAPMDMDMDMGAEEEGAEGALAGVSEEAVEALIGVVADALAGATGVEIDVTGAEEGMEDMEGEEGMDFAPAVGEEGEEELEDIDVVDTDAVMQETYSRVAKRLTGMNKQHKLVESVTNRIMQRLNKSK
jgi:hypothetical protein